MREWKTSECNRMLKYNIIGRYIIFFCPFNKEAIYKRESVASLQN
jgi:hypothetical protein